MILPGDEGCDYTISTSALGLLRTLGSDHSPEVRVADQLILHCGMLLMLSCSNVVDWSVTHVDGRVRLHDVVRVDDRGATRFPDLEAELPEDEYRRCIVAFAEKAFEDDDYDRELYRKFWEEYDGLLARHSG